MYCSFIPGHYISDIYNVQKNKWLSCDDSDIRDVTEDVVQSQRQKTGYIFFYMNK